jgi:spore coat protein U-like protein
MTRRDSHLRPVALAALLLGLTLPGAARAANNCNIITTGAVTFGTYLWTNPSPTDSVGTISYNCNSPAAVLLSAGNSGIASQRTLVSGTDKLNYNLYQDAGRRQIWGDFFTGGVPEFVVQSGRSDLSVYGRIPPGQNVAPGTYSDTVTITFLF